MRALEYLRPLTPEHRLLMEQIVGDTADVREGVQARARAAANGRTAVTVTFAGEFDEVVGATGDDVEGGGAAAFCAEATELLRHTGAVCERVAPGNSIDVVVRGTATACEAAASACEAGGS